MTFHTCFISLGRDCPAFEVRVSREGRGVRARQPSGVSRQGAGLRLCVARIGTVLFGGVVQEPVLTLVEVLVPVQPCVGGDPRPVKISLLPDACQDR